MRHLWHKIIVRYLRRVGWAFHAYPYGQRGFYVVLMSDAGYHAYTTLVSEVATLREECDRLRPACEDALNYFEQSWRQVGEHPYAVEAPFVDDLRTALDTRK